MVGAGGEDLSSRSRGACWARGLPQREAQAGPGLIWSPARTAQKISEWLRQFPRTYRAVNVVSQVDVRSFAMASRTIRAIFEGGSSPCLQEIHKFPMLSSTARRWRSSDLGETSRMWTLHRSLSFYILGSWPKSRWAIEAMVFPSSNRLSRRSKERCKKLTLIRPTGERVRQSLWKGSKCPTASLREVTELVRSHDSRLRRLRSIETKRP